MRRDDFDLEASHVAWVDEGGDPERPTVTIDFTGDAEDLHERLTGADDDFLDAGETDVAFRLQGDADDADTTGVVAVTNRVTGDYVLELNVAATSVFRFVRAARRYGKHAGGGGRYRVVIRRDGEELVTYEKDTLLVYNSEGDLLRSKSLIPSGVEL